MEFRAYRELVTAIPVGKQLPDAVYLHESALKHLPRELSTHVARTIVDLCLDGEPWNIVKFFKRDHKIALLSYPSFFEDSYPPLHQSITVDLEKLTFRKADYSKSDNPPILHRKETFLDPEHPEVPKFREITHEGVQAGLYENARSIGFKQSWERLISRKGYLLVDGRLVGKSDATPTPASVSHEVAVARHLTAIDRDKLSQPMQLLARHSYLNGDHSILDYGCGKGDDVRELEAHGVDVCAWDPIYRPDGTLRKTDIVNLGYVINVIEDRQERTKTLQAAYEHADKVLAVSAMVAGESLISQFRPYKDGVLTSRKTFQKYYTQSELRNYIETSLGESAIAVSPGIFFVFRDKLEEQRFLSERQHVRRTWTHLTVRERKTPESCITKDLIDKNQEIFDHFWNTTLDLGRIPANSEFEFSERLRMIAGSHAKAFDALTAHYGEDIYRQAEAARRSDLLVYFALGLFGRRKPYRHMPEGLKRDIKAFFTSYSTAQEEARALLFSVANPDNIESASLDALKVLQCGELIEGHSLVVHRSLILSLPPILRVYVGCATQLYGDIDTIDLVKIHFRSGKLSMMRYDDFEGKPIPSLIERIKVRMRDQDIDFFDYSGEYEPQPLYMKSTVIPTDFPKYKMQLKFDETLKARTNIDLSGFGPKRSELIQELRRCALKIEGFTLKPLPPTS